MKRILLALVMICSFAKAHIQFRLEGTANESKYGYTNGETYKFKFVVNSHTMVAQEIFSLQVQIVGAKHQQMIQIFLIILSLLVFQENIRQFFHLEALMEATMN